LTLGRVRPLLSAAAPDDVSISEKKAASAAGHWSRLILPRLEDLVCDPVKPLRFCAPAWRLDALLLGYPLLAAFQHAVFKEGFGDPLVVEAAAELVAKCLWMYKPRARHPIAVANRGMTIEIDTGFDAFSRHERIKTTDAVTLNEGPDGRDGLTFFKRTRTTPFEPLLERPYRCAFRRAGLPRQDAIFDRQCAGDGYDPEALSGALDLAVGSLRLVFLQ
jgi:hypothetical protein